MDGGGRVCTAKLGRCAATRICIAVSMSGSRGSTGSSCSSSPRRRPSHRGGAIMQGLPIVVIVFLVGALFFYSFRVLREYERGVIFQLGRFWSVKGPGLVIVWPVIQQMVKVSMRTVTMDVPSQDVISRDNVRSEERRVGKESRARCWPYP